MSSHAGIPLQPGDLFGNWVVLELVPKEQRTIACGLQYRCQCQCDHKTVSKVAGSALRRGRSTQCKKCAGVGVKSHNQARTPEYHAWLGLRDRCLNPLHAGYKNYGGRGIKVHPSWLPAGAGFLQFLRDVGPRPTKQHSIHRVDNDGDYAPGNCVWATDREQSRARRTNRQITHGGRTQILKDWLRDINLSATVFRRRCRDGWPEDVAATTPPIKDVLENVLRLLDPSSEAVRLLTPFVVYSGAVFERYEGPEP